MAAYLIASVLVKEDKWIPEYAKQVHLIAEKHGGRYLSRSANIEVLEGNPLETTLIAVIQFPDKAAAKAFANDPEYAPYSKARQDGTESRFQLIDDTDVAGTIPYLPK